MKNLSKKMVVTLYYSLITLCYYSLISAFIVSKNIEFSHPIKFNVLFTLILIFFLWRNVYHFNFHYYINKITRVMGKTVIVSFLSALTITTILNLIIDHNKFFKVNFYNFILYTLGLLLFIFIIHIIQYSWIKNLGYLGYFHKRVLIIGNICSNYNTDFHFNDIWNSRILVGVLNKVNDKWLFNDDELTNSYSTWEDLIYIQNIGKVILFSDHGNLNKEEKKILSFLEENEIPYSVYKRNSKATDFKLSKDITVPLCFEKSIPTRDSLKMISVKRILSILLALFGIIAGLPFWIIISLAIKLHDKGPILYISKRVGKNGREFNFYKFRTMVLNADKMKDELLKHNERQDGPLFKMKNDPRVTPLGRILRKYSIDEFPQLINILKGDMCFIGPRPHLPKEVAEYTPRDYLRLECIPGLSCLPQINDRNNIGFRDWVELDLKYRKEWSLKLDIIIFFKTIGVAIAPLFSRDGGY